MAGLAADSLEKLLYNNQFADFTISCGNKEFKVHRAIVCSDSYFFEAVCNHDFKVGMIGPSGAPLKG